MDYTTLNALPTAELTNMYNEVFAKSVKPGTYSKDKMSSALAAEFERVALEDADDADLIGTPATDPVDLVATDIAYNDPTLTPENDAPELESESEPGEAVEPPAIDPTQANMTEGKCPVGHDPSSLTAAGVEGTTFNENHLFCHECNKAFNVYNGEFVVDVPAQPTTKKRRIINPQGKIDAKSEALKKAGFNLVYNRPARTWFILELETDYQVAHMNSRDFSEFKPTDIVAYAIMLLALADRAAEEEGDAEEEGSDE